MLLIYGISEFGYATYSFIAFYATTFNLICETGTPPLLTPYMTIIAQHQLRNPDIIIRVIPHYSWVSIFPDRNLLEELLVGQILAVAGSLLVVRQNLVVEGIRLEILVVHL